MASLEDQIRKEKEDYNRLAREYESVQRLEKVSKTTKDVIDKATEPDPMTDPAANKDNPFNKKKGCNLL